MNNEKHAHLHWSNPTLNDHKPRVFPLYPTQIPNPTPPFHPHLPQALLPLKSYPHPQVALILPLASSSFQQLPTQNILARF